MKKVARVIVPFAFFLLIMSCSSTPGLEGTWYDCSNQGGYDLKIAKEGAGYSVTANGRNVYFDNHADTLLIGVNEEVSIKYVSSTKHLIVTEGFNRKEYCKK